MVPSYVSKLIFTELEARLLLAEIKLKSRTSRLVEHAIFEPVIIKRRILFLILSTIKIIYLKSIRI